MDDETIKYCPLPEEMTTIGPAKDKPLRPRKKRAKSEEIISMSEQENFVELALETIEKEKQESLVEQKKSPIDVFTHSRTGFPGAWPEEEIVELLNAWEQATDALRVSEKPFNVCSRVMEILKKDGFREVRKYDVWNQMQKLRTEYRTYQGLQDLGLETVQAGCLSQMMRIFRKRRKQKFRRRRTSTASNLDVVSEDSTGPNENQLKPDVIDQGSNRNKRVSFQRQNLQRSVRVMIGQQKTILEYLQSVFKTIDESNNRVIGLLEQLVALQKN